MKPSNGYTGHQLATVATYHPCTAPYFGGVKAANSLPASVERYPIFFIVNSDLWWERGSHWLLIIIPAAGETSLIYFDSLGRGPRHYSHYIENFLRGHSTDRYLANTLRYQPTHSSLCGLYCLYVADKICQGETFAAALQSLNPHHLEANDQMVASYYQAHLLESL